MRLHPQIGLGPAEAMIPYLVRIGRSDAIDREQATNRPVVCLREVKESWAICCEHTGNMLYDRVPLVSQAAVQELTDPFAHFSS